MNGILLIDKPRGWTSFDVVNKVRCMIEQHGLHATHKKRFPVGHTGTLDPMATGLLMLMCGTYTKKVPQYVKLDKTYEVTMRLGQVSTTGDEEGEKTPVSEKRPTLEELHIAAARFEGDTLQTPPAFSAIKINGQRAYKIARSGEVPQLTPRPVHIERILITGYAYPDVQFTAHVSSGTYVRSLVEDIGKALATGAYMADLRRTRVGKCMVDDAIPIASLTPELLRDNMRD